VLPIDPGQAVSKTASPIFDDKGKKIIGVQHIIVPDDDGTNTITMKQLSAITREAQQKQIMIELGQALLTNGHSMQEIADGIFKPIQQLIPCDALSILLLDDKAGNLRVIASHGHSKNGVDVTGQSIPILPHILQIIESKEPIIIQDTATDPRWQKKPGSEWIASLIGVPLVKKHKTGHK